MFFHFDMLREYRVEFYKFEKMLEKEIKDSGSTNVYQFAQNFGNSVIPKLEVHTAKVENMFTKEDQVLVQEETLIDEVALRIFGVGDFRLRSKFQQFVSEESDLRNNILEIKKWHRNLHMHTIGLRNLLAERKGNMKEYCKELKGYVVAIGNDLAKIEEFSFKAAQVLPKLLKKVDAKHRLLQEEDRKLMEFEANIASWIRATEQESAMDKDDLNLAA